MLPSDPQEIGTTDGRRHLDTTICQQGADALAQEIGVLEEHEQAKVEHQGQNHEGLCHSTLFLHPRNRLGDEVVGGGHQSQKPEEETAGLVVEVIREKGDEEDAERVCLPQQIIDECEPQKQEQEDA